MDMSNTEEEIKEWQNLNPDVVLLAIRCDVRYTAEEFAILNEIRNVWGDNSLFSRLVVAFTFGDRLDGNIKDEVINVCKELQTVLKDCGERYVVFNSRGTDDDKKRQVQEVRKLLVHLGKKTVSVSVWLFMYSVCVCVYFIVCEFQKAARVPTIFSLALLMTAVIAD